MAILHNNGKQALYADPSRRSIEVQIPDASGHKLLFDFDTDFSEIKEAELIGISVHVHPWVQTDIERAVRTLVQT